MVAQLLLIALISGTCAYVAPLTVQLAVYTLHKDDIRHQ
jgi:hypothetical protein